MKIALISTGVLLLTVAGFFIMSKPAEQSSSVAQATSQEPRLTIDTINAEKSNGAAFIDVRTPEEYNAGYIEGASLLPLAGIQAGTYPEVQKDQKVYVYCRSGNRSAQAKSLLEKAGYTQVIDLGAYNDVVALGGKLVK